MSTPRPADGPEKGLTLLELQVALVILALLVVGVLALMREHSSLVSGMEDWCRGEPTRWVVPAGERWERWLGVPAALETTDTTVPATAPRTGAYTITVLSFARSVHPSHAEITLTREHGR